MNPALRQIIATGVAVALFVGLFFMGAKTGTPASQPPKPAPPTQARLVETFAAANQSIQTKIPIYGRLIPVEKTELFAEVNGMLRPNSPSFRHGVRFTKGTPILLIDDTEARLALQAQRSALLTTITQMMPDFRIDFADHLDEWNAYRQNFNVEAPIAPLPTPKSDRERDYITLKNIYNQYYTIKSAEERLSKYTVYAPFAGEVMESSINTGSYIRAGQKLGTLMNTSSYELEASVPLEDLQYLQIGHSVRLQSEDFPGQSWTGRIARIGSSVDSKTQTVKAYIQVSGNNLREFMFLSGEVDANTIASVVEIPRKLLIDNEKVYAVRDTSLAAIAVQVVKMTEETAFVRGVPDGSRLLRTVPTGAFEGMLVKEAKN